RAGGCSGTRSPRTFSSAISSTCSSGASDAVEWSLDRFTASSLPEMADIDRFRPEDRRQVEALYRRVFGPDLAEANRLRWEWQYRRNPYVPPGGPLIWLAREGTTIVGQYATMPVRLSVNGQEIDASWGT